MPTRLTALATATNPQGAHQGAGRRVPSLFDIKQFCKSAVLPVDRPIIFVYNLFIAVNQSVNHQGNIMIINAQFDNFVKNEIETQVNQWFVAQYQNPFNAFYAYYLPAQEKLLITSAEYPPQGWEIVSPQRISPGWTKERARTFIQELCFRLPILKVN